MDSAEILRTVNSGVAWVMVWTWVNLASRTWANGTWIKDSILYRPEGVTLAWTASGKAQLLAHPDYHEDDAPEPLDLPVFLKGRWPWQRMRTWVALCPPGSNYLISVGVMKLTVAVLPAYTRVVLEEFDVEQPPKPPRKPRGGLTIPAFPTFGATTNLA